MKTQVPEDQPVPVSQLVTLEYQTQTGRNFKRPKSALRDKKKPERGRSKRKQTESKKPERKQQLKLKL
jgi:hypothetical protein